MKLSLEQTQGLIEVLDGGQIREDLEQFILSYGYDESNEPDLEYYTETITYEHRGSTLKGESK